MATLSAPHDETIIHPTYHKERYHATIFMTRSVERIRSNGLKHGIIKKGDIQLLDIKQWRI